MEIKVTDKRDLEILAKGRPVKNMRKIMTLFPAGIILGVVGLFFVQPLAFGFFIVFLSCLVMVLPAFIIDRKIVKNKKEFIDYCETNGTIPPWPEDKQ